jgi:hypothetical protein
MSAASDLVTTVAAAGQTFAEKAAVLIDGIQAMIAADVASPGADQAALIVKLNARLADIDANQANLKAALMTNTPVQPQAGVRPLVF